MGYLDFYIMITDASMFNEVPEAQYKIRSIFERGCV